MDFAIARQLPPEEVCERLVALARETGRQDLVDLAGDLREQGSEALHDRISTRLMELFRDTASPQTFALIYELNYRPFFLTILGRLRRNQFVLDAGDVLQEVFVNIYRYPLRFKADRPEAFRYWAGTIIRNTILRFLRGMAKESRIETPLEDLLEPADETQHTPQEKLIESESAETCQKTWIFYLNLYMHEFGRLSPREQEALKLVEVEGFSYREVSAEMDIKVENLKMVIFRARRKILRNMQLWLETQARTPCEAAAP